VNKYFDFQNIKILNPNVIEKIQIFQKFIEVDIILFSNIFEKVDEMKI